jgi:hypothetical protein
MKALVITIYCCLLLVNVLSAKELPPPFSQFETASTAGSNGTVYTWG